MDNTLILFYDNKKGQMDNTVFSTNDNKKQRQMDNTKLLTNDNEKQGQRDNTIISSFNQW